SPPANGTISGCSGRPLLVNGLASTSTNRLAWGSSTATRPSTSRGATSTSVGTSTPISTPSPRPAGPSGCTLSVVVSTNAGRSATTVSFPRCPSGTLTGQLTSRASLASQHSSPLSTRSSHSVPSLVTTGSASGPPTSIGPPSAPKRMIRPACRYTAYGPPLASSITGGSGDTDGRTPATLMSALPNSTTCSLPTTYPLLSPWTTWLSGSAMPFMSTSASTAWLAPST